MLTIPHRSGPGALGEPETGAGQAEAAGALAAHRGASKHAWSIALSTDLGGVGSEVAVIDA